MKLCLSTVLFVAAGCLALAALGCSNSSSDKSSGDGLRAVSVPSDFTFATSRSVSLSLSASQAVIGEQPAALEVTTGEGKVLFRGSLKAGTPLSIQLPVATKDSQLTATLFVNNEPKKAVIDIKDGAASHSFE